MADRTLKLRELRAKLARYGIEEDSSRGKGSHTVFFQRAQDGIISFPVPTTRQDVLRCYVAGCRRRFGLRPEDGISDQEFYSK